MLRFMFHVCLAVSLAAAPAIAQDSATAKAGADTARAGRVERARESAAALGRRSLSIARQGERVVFGADSAVEAWTSHDDRASRAIRRLAPIAFWVPIAAVATTPVVWADEAQDGNATNAQYARNATAALAIGFAASRTAKHFIHRARPCTGESPGVISV